MVRERAAEDGKIGRETDRERDRLLPTLVGNVFQRKRIENPLLFLAIGGRKRGGFTPVVALLRQLPKIFFIPFEPSSLLPLGDARPPPLLRAILC